jgi:iron complex outermembrane receptor protein
VYGTVARGYRPGGFSFLTDDPARARFAPQTDVSYEGGVKTASWNRRLRAALALFDVQSHDYQVQQRAGFSSFTILNAQRVVSRGVETELHAVPAHGLTLGATFGYVDARYHHFRVPGTTERFDGRPVALVPEYDATVDGEYRHRSGLFGRAEYQRVGEYPFVHGDSFRQTAYGLVNVRLGYATAHVEVSAFAHNLTDTLYSPLAIPGGPQGRFLVVPGDPRTFGVALRGRF